MVLFRWAALHLNIALPPVIHFNLIRAVIFDHAPLHIICVVIVMRHVRIDLL